MYPFSSESSWNFVGHWRGAEILLSQKLELMRNCILLCSFIHNRFTSQYGYFAVQEVVLRSTRSLCAVQMSFSTAHIYDSCAF